MRLVFTLLVLLVCWPISGCRSQPSWGTEPTSQPTATSAGTVLAPSPPAGMEAAVFAGGCFWCMEGPFEALDGVSEVLSGYTGGGEESPAYQQVARGATGHTEAVYIIFNPAVVSYETLVETFWRSMDPTDAGGQFADRGTQYRPAIFVTSEQQRTVAVQSKDALAASGRFQAPIIVPVEDAGPFWVAEDYHQNYYQTNSAHYNAYRRGSGRAGFLERVWGAEGAH